MILNRLVHSGIWLSSIFSDFFLSLFNSLNSLLWTAWLEGRSVRSISHCYYILLVILVLDSELMIIYSSFQFTPEFIPVVLPAFLVIFMWFLGNAILVQDIPIIWNGSSDTVLQLTYHCNLKLHIVKSRTSCLTLVTNVSEHWDRVPVYSILKLPINSVELSFKAPLNNCFQNFL